MSLVRIQRHGQFPSLLKTASILDAYNHKSDVQLVANETANVLMLQ